MQAGVKRGVTMGWTSDRPPSSARISSMDRALAATALRPVFDATRCADETFSKPHPGMLFELMEVLDVPPEEVIMIGDTSHDLRMATNAGVHGLAVTYGAHARPELASCAPQAIVNNVAELRDWLVPRIAGRVSTAG